MSRDTKKSGGRSGFDEFYRSHYEMAYRYIRAQRFPENHCQDILSRCFELAWERFDEYVEQDEPPYWFFNIVQNKAGYERRKRARARVVSLPNDALDLNPSRADAPEQTVLAREQSSQLQAVLRELPDHYQIVVKLRLEGFAYAEIARMTNTSVKAAQHRMKRAMVKMEGFLREFIHSYGE